MGKGGRLKVGEMKIMYTCVIVGKVWTQSRRKQETGHRAHGATATTTANILDPLHNPHVTLPSPSQPSHQTSAFSL